MFRFDQCQMDNTKLICLNSGKFWIVDPYHLEKWIYFEGTEYGEVKCYSRKIKHERQLAYVCVELNDHEVVSYEMVEKGFESKSGYACFMNDKVLLDPETLTTLTTKLTHSNHLGYSFCEINQNIVAFTCPSDEVYYCYQGYDKNGELCQVVFDLLEEKDDYDRLIHFANEDWGPIIDDGDWHYDKIEKLQLPLEELNGFNHLAIFFKWALDHHYISDLLMEAFPSLYEMSQEVDLREIIAYLPVFDEKLKLNFFKEDIHDFILSFYIFNAEGESFPKCVDIHAEHYLGTEIYHSEALHNEAYLFVPYDESIYRGLYEMIEKAFERWKSLKKS